jgi:hypothetical protein
MNTDIILSVCYTEQDGCKSQTKAWRQALHTFSDIIVATFICFYSKVSFFSYFIESLRISCAVVFEMVDLQKYIGVHISGEFCCCWWRGHF